MTSTVYVLIGASGSGKSTWAAEHFAGGEIVSSDALRAVVGTGDADLDASKDAFAVLDLVVAARLRRRLTTVIDTLGLDPERRLGYLHAAREAGLPAVAVVFDTASERCRDRNRNRDRPVPAAVLKTQLRKVRELAVEAEGWDRVERVAATDPGASAAPSPAKAPESPTGLSFVLHVSRFPWDPDPAEWLTSVALAAADAGFGGLALMDHLIQIPQVGRAWEPIPEPWVTLGLLAGLPTSLRLGTLVSPVSLHSPGRLAKAAATLDTLSGGRAFCGIGAGWFEREHAGFGVPFPPPPERVAALRAAIPVMRALWAPGTKPAAGLPETTSYPRPVGELPLLVGGRGAAVLRVAAELADGCNVPASVELVERAAAIMAGKRVTVLDVPVLGRDRDDAAAIVERLRGRVSAAAFARTHHAGVAAEHSARYRELADHGVDTVFVAVPDLRGADDLAKFSEVVAAFS
ncbi:MAG TPA: LLM class flavin-dependent oxidoreductase [Jatrophihabitans sp.]|jgi:alkanesulfonate monooxygenase SsuD/methylene tetrahydromethanopterin reductase-like flavin-dependent oxidoreductase (luciferase family)/predicted kinase